MKEYLRKNKSSEGAFINILTVRNHAFHGNKRGGK